MSSHEKRLAGIVAALSLIALVALWTTWSSRRGLHTGGLSVSFAGLTNAASGAVVAQFQVANAFPRRVRFGICEAQVRQTNGWPNWGRVAGGSNWIAVAAHSDVLISIVAPPVKEGNSWRAPVMYEEDPAFITEVRDRVKGIVNWLCGNRSYRIMRARGFAYSPELAGGSNQPVQGDSSNNPAGQTSHTSTAVRSSR